MDKITEIFTHYLQDARVSKITTKNYLSDLRNFEGFLKAEVSKIGAQIESLTEAIPFIGHSTAANYKKYLMSETSSNQTINRRLSTMRKFSALLFEQGFLSYHFARDIETVNLSSNKPQPNSFVVQFETYLRNQSVSKNTIKNYIADIKHFANWIESNQN